jgi:hypothetical protein
VTTPTGSIFGRLFGWLKGQPGTTARSPAAPKGAKPAKSGKSAFDERLVAADRDEDVTVRDGSDDVTIMEARARAARAAQPPPNEFRYNPNLKAALPVTPDAAAEAVKRVAGEIATRLKVADVPLEFESGALENLKVSVRGSARALDVALSNAPAAKLEALRAQARIFDRALEAAGLKLHHLDGVPPPSSAASS